MCYYVEYIEKLDNFFLSQYGEVLDQNSIDAFLQFDTPLFYFVGGFEHPKFPIVHHSGVDLMEWGLIPFWTKDATQAKDIRVKTLNAVSETAFEKPSFRESIKKRRGLLTVTAFFEWRDVAGKKYPYRIALQDQQVFSLGCIYDNWVDKETGEMRMTFSILTTEANELMANIHNSKKRMPVIIEKENFKRWLDPTTNKEEIINLMQPLNADKMCAHTISQFANNSRNYRNIPGISEVVNYPEIEAL